MNEPEKQTCPLCAEPVKAVAVVCPHCQGRLRSGLIEETYRNRPGRQIAGVAIALAEVLGVSVTFVRLAFVIFTFINFLGPVIYVTLWLVLPAEPGHASPLGKVFAAVPGEDGEQSHFERLMAEVRSLYLRTRDHFRSRQKKTNDPPEGPGPAAEPTS